MADHFDPPQLLNTKTDKPEPWHTLTATVTHYHPWPDCEGHPTADAEGAETEADFEFELTHPDTCPPIPAEQPCCCKLERHESPHIHIPPGGTLQCACTTCLPPNGCQPCVDNQHEHCPARGPRCWTEREMQENADWNGLHELETGTYRIHPWGSGPDHNGEYDGGMEIEPLPAAEGTAAA